MTAVLHWFRLHWPEALTFLSVGFLVALAKFTAGWPGAGFALGMYAVGMIVGNIVMPWAERRNTQLTLPDIPDDYNDFVRMEAEAYDITGGSPVNKVEVHCNDHGAVLTLIHFDFEDYGPQTIRWIWHEMMGPSIKTEFTKFAQSAAKSDDWPFIAGGKPQ